MKTYLLLLLSLLVPFYAQAQTSVTVASGVPQNVIASATYSGTVGQSPIYYYVCARYPSGYTCMTQPVTATRTPGISGLGGGNSVLVNWSPGVQGATGYDVIRSASGGSFNGVCSGCAIALNLTALSYTDASAAAGSSYPPGGLTPAGPASGQIILDGVDYPTAALLWNFAGGPYPFALFPPGFVSGDCVQGLSVPPFIADAGFPCSVGGSGINQLHGDVLAGPGTGNQSATVVGVNGALVGANIAVLGTNAGKQLRADTSANVASLWTGTGCSGAVAMGLDGNCYGTGAGLSFSAAPTANAILTDTDATHIQTPNATTTVDSSGDISAQGNISAAGTLNSGVSAGRRRTALAP